MIQSLSRVFFFFRRARALHLIRTTAAMVLAQSASSLELRSSAVQLRRRSGGRHYRTPVHRRNAESTCATTVTTARLRWGVAGAAGAGLAAAGRATASMG